MEKRNIYKDIVAAGAAALCIFFLAGKAKAWQQSQELCKMSIQAGGSLTEEVVEEFGKLPGITLFLPTDTVTVNIALGEYAMETELMGVVFGEYPLEWETAEPEIRLGNTAMLFVGKECFASFLDRNGYAPTKGQVEKWQQGYPQLELTITDGTGHARKARICGILKDPAAQICMEQSQMQEVFGKAASAKGGYMEIQGVQNAEKARRLLEGAGFQVAAEGSAKE